MRNVVAGAWLMTSAAAGGKVVMSGGLGVGVVAGVVLLAVLVLALVASVVHAGDGEPSMRLFDLVALVLNRKERLRRAQRRPPRPDRRQPKEKKEQK